MKQSVWIAMIGCCVLNSALGAQSASPASNSTTAKVRIALVGDSTVNTGGGWGTGFCALLTPQVECINLARNGRSSKSYYNEGLWKEALEKHADYMLIQFGHNDMPGKGPDRETDPKPPTWKTCAATFRKHAPTDRNR